MSPSERPSAPDYSDPDFVDRVFDYLLVLRPDLRGSAEPVKAALREEFAGQEVYIRHKDSGLARQVLRLFNGRNASEVARTLRCGRATVYRLLKQSRQNG